MGSWQLEVVRMMLYISFPVGMFHYFNQRENVEEWMIEERKKRCPPMQGERLEEFTQFLEEFSKQKQIKQLMEMEEQYNMKMKQTA